ncbi:MAG: alanine racemase [Candidatus Gracilibacteria bacterium]|nr:alanine racemase [Candidatus Gracilibacteria bacterium]
MKLNTQLLEKIRNSESRILVVTKYLDKKDTEEVVLFMEQNYFDILEGFGENRLEGVKLKEFDREKSHFIGNIQTKQIKEIVKDCLVIHSVDDMKQILRMEEICSKADLWVQIFLQINVDVTKPGGVEVDKIPEFLKVIGEMENISLIGFSAIGRSEFTREEKEKEFDLLLNLRNKYIPNGFISAGTSIDYEIALEKGIDIVRIGNALYN